MALPRASGVGALHPLTRVPSKVASVNTLRTLSLGSGNWSSCPRLCENSCVQFARRKFFSFGQSENQKFWQRLFEEANRENCSTLSWLAHVFTRPGPTPAVRNSRRDWLNRVESRSGAVTVGRACLFPPLSS